jgi:hypothetical protein
MVRGFAFMFVFWVLVTIGFVTYSHLSSNAKLTLIRSAIYGLFTAIVAGIGVAAMVYWF